MVKVKERERGRREDKEVFVCVYKCVNACVGRMVAEKEEEE